MIIKSKIKYSCKHCEGVISIKILRDTEKTTMPEIEFCSFCGMSNLYVEKSNKSGGKKL